MIEIRPRTEVTGRDERWIQATSRLLIENINFNRSVVRIDNVIYTECSDEFIEAFNKAMLFLKIQGNS